MSRRGQRKTIYSETQLYHDAVIFLNVLMPIVKNMPKPIQYSIGELLLKDAIKAVQLLKIAYDEESLYKWQYVNEMRHTLKRLEATINVMFDCRYITERQKSNLYMPLGSMQKQTRAWKEKVSQTKLKDDCQEIQ